MSYLIRYLTLGLVLATAAPVMAQRIHTEYLPTDEIIENPERGFYTHQAVQAESTPLSSVRVRGFREDDGVTLVLRIYYLKKFRDAPLSDEQLELVQQDMDALREGGAKAIIRFAYTSRETEPDAPLHIIEQHLDQLEPILRANKDVIAAAEAGFIGAWGEWYYSSEGLNTTEGRRAVLNKWLDVLPVDRMVQVRTPGYKKAIFDRTSPLTPEEAHDGSDYARTGHHNDCFLASSSDYGTYSSPTDKVFLQSDSRYTTMGGETCNPNPPRSECTTAITEMEAFHWSYINQDYHGTVLSSWETGGCMDEVKRRLGYRFVLIDSDVPASVSPGSTYSFDLRLTNVGFAAPYNPRGVEIVLREQATGARYVVALDEDPRFWAPGDTVSISASVGVPADLPDGTYEVLLNLPAPERSIYERPEYAIRVANADVWEPETGYNALQAATAIEAGAPGTPYEGSAWFRSHAEHVSTDRAELPDAGWRVSPAYPNPFNGDTEVVVTVPYAQPVTVGVYDVLGRRIATLHHGLLAAGNEYRFTFDSTGHPGGLYMLAVQGASFRATRSALLVP